MTIVAAITTISDAVLGVIRLATYLRDPFRGLRRLYKPMLGRIVVYRIPTTGPTTRDLPQGADPRAWSWRATRPRRVQRRAHEPHQRSTPGLAERRLTHTAWRKDAARRDHDGVNPSLP